MVWPKGCSGEAPSWPLPCPPHWPPHPPHLLRRRGGCVPTRASVCARPVTRARGPQTQRASSTPPPCPFPQAPSRQRSWRGQEKLALLPKFTFINAYCFLLNFLTSFPLCCFSCLTPHPEKPQGLVLPTTLKARGAGLSSKARLSSPVRDLALLRAGLGSAAGQSCPSQPCPSGSPFLPCVTGDGNSPSPWGCKD